MKFKLTSIEGVVSHDKQDGIKTLHLYGLAWAGSQSEHNTRIGLIANWPRFRDFSRKGGDQN